METLLDKRLWENTPEDFETNDFIALAQKLGMSSPTAERRLSKWTGDKRLIKLKNGKYKKLQKKQSQVQREIPN